MVEGFETYRAFAPGVLRPSADEIAQILEARLETPPVWCELAEQGADVAGYVALLPAADSRRPVEDPGLAHFWMLFVRAPWWGTGLAHRLHGAACEAAAARGYTAMRLFTPAGQARARRF
jgi:GNAT superfamily N-acetyltransferase